MGKDTFMIAKQQATGFPGLGNLKAEIIAEASKHCASLGKELHIVSTQETHPLYIIRNYPRSEIQFMCLTKGDQSFERSKLQRVPDTVIEAPHQETEIYAGLYAYGFEYSAFISCFKLAIENGKVEPEYESDITFKDESVSFDGYSSYFRKAYVPVYIKVRGKLVPSINDWMGHTHTVEIHEHKGGIL